MKSKTRLAALFCFLAISVSSALAADLPAESQVPGDVRVARWDVILNDNGLESVDSTDNSVVHTSSVGYSGAIFNADALRAAVNAAQAVGGLEGGSQSMAYTQIFGNGMYNMQQLYFNYFQGQGAHVGLQGNALGTETYDSPDAGHIHINLNYTQFNRQLLEGNNGQLRFTPLENKASIIYDGQLRPGDALAFSGTFKGGDKIEYRHMIVWEVFKAEQRYQQNFQVMQDSERWCQFGPKTIRDDADIALVWEAQAKHPASTVAPKWEQTLEDGKKVRLIGVTRTDKWLYCWWDADGQPIENHDWISFNKYYQNQPVWFSVEVTGPAEEWKRQTPTGNPGFNRGQLTNPFRINTSMAAEQAGQAVVGVPVGPWEQIGEIKKGGLIKVGNTTFRLRDVQSPSPNYMYAQFFPERGNMNSDEIVTLSAVGQDGTEVDTNSSPSITGKNYGTPLPNFQGMSLKNLKTFHVWKRKQQWVTFSGFAQQPLTPPKDHVTAEEISAAKELQDKAQQQIQVQSIQQQMAGMKDKLKAWRAIPVDPKTPKGALRALFEAARKGDLQGVRARMKASQPDSGPMLDLAARLITATQFVRTTAIARFGEVNIESLQPENTNGMGPPVLMDLEMQMAA